MLESNAPTPTVFLSTLSLRRATYGLRWEVQIVMISIHALLAESDLLRFSTSEVVTISIHALLAESDDNITQGVFNLFAFLSTLSLRRAT